MTVKIFLTILILSFLTLSSANGQTLDTLEHTIETVTPDTSIASTSGDNYEDDDFSPGLLFFALIGIGLIFICIGVGVVIAAVVLLSVLGLISIGVLSTSVIVGMNKKSFTKGFKTFLILSASIGGLVIGSGSLYLINRFFDLQLSFNTAILIGAVSGIIGGILLGQLFYVMLRKMINYLRLRLKIDSPPGVS